MEDIVTDCPYCLASLTEVVPQGDAQSHRDWIYSTGQVGPNDRILYCKQCDQIASIGPMGNIYAIGGSKLHFATIH